MIDETGFVQARPGEKPWHPNAFRAPVVYVVAWADREIVKVGRSKLSRWVTFQDRGAVCLGLAPYPTLRKCLDVEAWFLQQIEASHDKAFDGPCPEAEEVLGHHGSGWSECFNMRISCAVRWMATLRCAEQVAA